VKCPGCGFENMPGLNRCVVCDREIGVSAPGKRLYPLRARDRSIWDRFRFRARRDWSRISLYAGRSTPLKKMPSPLSENPPMRAREFGLALLSVIPGLGHIFVLEKRKTGACILLGSILALATGICLYAHSVSDVLFCSVILLSAFSVWSVVREFLKDRGRRLVSDIGIALMVISIYLSTYVVVDIVLRPVGNIMSIVATPMTSRVSIHDSVLVVPLKEIKRGVIIVTTWHGEGTGLGPILGMPGETVTLQDSRVYVNGIPTEIVRRLGTGTNASIQTVKLNSNQIWIPPTIETGGTDIGMWLRLGVVERFNILGRVAAVVAPAAHRHVLQ